MAKHKKSPSLGRLLRRASFRACLITGSFIVGFGLNPFGNIGVYVPEVPVQPAPAEQTLTSTEKLLKQHDDSCWTKGEEPKAEFPTASIVKLSSGEVIYTEDQKLVDQAFDKVIAGLVGDPVSDAGVIPVALCV